MIIANGMQVYQKNTYVAHPMVTYDLRHSQGPDYWAPFPPEYDGQSCITVPLGFLSNYPREPTGICASYDTPPPLPYANIDDGAVQQPAMAQNSTYGEELAVATAASHSESDSPFLDGQSPNLPFHLRDVLRSDQTYLNTIHLRIIVHEHRGEHHHEEYIKDCDYPRQCAFDQLYSDCRVLGPQLKCLEVAICLPELAVPHVPFVAQELTDMYPDLEELVIDDTLCRLENYEVSRAPPCCPVSPG